MGTLKNPKIWVPLPYVNPEDCSRGICSLPCTQWCYHLFPPPPSSFSFPLDTSSSGPTFSPLVITIIGVFVSAFLLVSYYLILTKYCGNSEPSRRVEENHPRLEGEEDDGHGHGYGHDHDTQHEPWVISTIGLDEALIKSITLVKFKKGDGKFLSGDCSVCLGEFQEDDSLRLLPKCSHAFHVDCIDTWLRSHSNCPLCRANIFSTTTQQPPPPTPPVVVGISNHQNQHSPQDHEPPPAPQTQVAINEEDHQANGGNLPKRPSRAHSDGRLHGGQEGHMMMRRSISMDHWHETRISISDILRMESKEEGAGESSKFSSNEISGNEVLCSVMNSMAMKRSFSSGRLSFFTKHGRGRNNATIIPM